MMTLAGEIQISTRKIKSILHDPEKSAKAINLVYVQDKEPGIRRVRNGEAFQYFIGRKKLGNKTILERIRKLAIPPAWEDVWICRLENGHLQATGIDVRNRKQYKYHSLWNSLRNHTKFYRLHEFGKAIPSIRQQLQKDLSLKGLPVEKVLAAVVCLMEQTSIRIGNTMYEKLYGSFGLTTLKDQHVKIAGDQMRFVFKGKKGISHNVSIKSKRLAKIVKQCRDIPGKKLFQYYDHDGKARCIDSGMVNSYLKAITGQDFTAKDFRTWAGTLHAIIAFREIGISESKKQAKANVVAALDRVASHLGNTRTVCKKYYVHPAIIDLYERKALHLYLDQIEKIEGEMQLAELACEEKLLLTILEKERLVCL